MAEPDTRGSASCRVFWYDRRMVVLGVDPGARRIGLAIADDEIGIATPLPALAGGGTPDACARRLADEATRREAQKVVLGLPLRLDGSRGEAARRAELLAASLRAASSAEVVLWDERLTTKAAERSLDALGTRGKRRREVVDSMAAALILQSYLEAEQRRKDDGSAFEG